MSKNKILLAVLLVAVFVGGYASGRAYKNYEVNLDKLTQAKKEMMDHTSMAEMKHDHLMVAPGRINPKVTIKAFKDSMSGYNIQILTQAFAFTPQNAGLDPVQNTGHAHVFVNGVKVGRAYGAWFNIDDSHFKNGTNTITVSLNANNHSDWVAKDGSEIRASVEVVK